MKIGKYISELLFENDFVILPQLGEFSTKYIPAKFIPELKKVESPSKVITFNDKNKSGGGLLTEYIAQKEGISSQEAKEFVSNFVAEMQNSLKSGKKVELENIGVFSMDPSGQILFDADRSVNYLNDAAGLSSVKEPAKKTEEESKSELDKVLEEVQPPAVEKNEPVTEPSDEAQPEDTPVEENEATPEIEPEEPKKPTSVPLGQRSRNIHDSAGQKMGASNDQEETNDSDRDGLPPALKWIALTVVPLLIIILVLALNFEYIFGDKATVWNKDNETETEQTTPVADTQIQADAQEQQPVIDEPEEAFDPTIPPPPPERGRKVYYIIVGSFEEEHSAVILAEELRTEGARTASVFPVNRLGFYRVSYGYYYDLNEAERDLNLAKEINPNSWILHR